MIFFFFNDTATTEIYTLSLHDALPIWREERHPERAVLPGPLPRLPRHAWRAHHRGHGAGRGGRRDGGGRAHRQARALRGDRRDRKSTRLNSSHAKNSYAVFCFKKKNKK